MRHPRMTTSSKSILTVFLLFAFCHPPCQAASDSKELQEEHQLSLAFETPHTKWAKPYAGGKVRALFFLDIGYCGTVPRQVIELKQRFDLEAEAVYWANIIDSPKYHWHGDEAGIARMKRLLDQPWDCFVFVGLPPERLPVEQQYAMLLQITRGAGLVLMGVDDRRLLKPERQDRELPDFLSAGIPLSGLSFVRDTHLKNAPENAGADAIAAYKMVATYRIKDGRGIRLPAMPNLEYRPGWDTEFEYWNALVGRALFWAAGKQPRIHLNIAVAPISLDRTALPQEALTISYRNDADTKLMTFRVSLRRYDGYRISLPEQTTPATQRKVWYVFTRALPKLRADRYFVDVIASSKAGIEGWGSSSFVVTSPRTVKEVALTKSWSEVGGMLTGEVSLAGSPLPGNEKVRIDLCDRRNRVIARQESSARDNRAAFSFKVQPWMPMLIRVEAALISAGQEVSTAYNYFNVTKRHQGQFNFVMWDIPSGTLAPYGEESLGRLGVTAHLSGGAPPRTAAAYNMSWVPYTTRITADKDKNGYMLPTCWNHEPDVSNYVKGIVEPREKTREHGVFVYSLGDEGVTRGACIHPDCLAAFRRYLAKEYGTIAALNQSWGTSYKSFDEVTLDPPEDSEASSAKRNKNYPRWYDRQAYQSANFAGFCKRFVDGFRQLDPKSKVGFEGAGTFEQGDDYDLIVRTNGFWSPYPGLGDEIIRSIAPRDFPRSNWMGYTKDADSLLAKYWRMITRGNDSVWWWRWDGVGIFHGFLAPHLGPYDATREIVRDTQVVRNGLGTLLIKSQMQDDGIALLYSVPSAYACQVEQGPRFGNYAKTHETWSRTLRELGLQYRYVTDRMLRLGEFDAKKFKVLILARTEALGDKEADVIRKFVQGGGTVIADLRPGIYDGHCKPRSNGILDDLFGIKRSGTKLEPAVGAAIFLNEKTQFEKTNCDPSVQLAGGQSGGKCVKTPLFIAHRVGKGQAVLLNLNLCTYPALGNDRTPEAAANLFKQLVATAAVQPTITATRKNGARLRNLETVRWRNGDTELLALFREGGQPEEATVNLSEARHVYDLRRHSYLGQVKTFNTKIIPCRATFFALAPTPVQTTSVALSSANVTPGTVLTATVRVPGANSVQAVKLRAFQPTGQPADWLDTVVMVPPGGSTVSLPVAFNDPSGKWTLTVTELYTNKSTKTTFVVQ